MDLKASPGCVVRSVRCPPIGEALGQIDIFVISVGHADLWSDALPYRHLVAKSGTTSGQAGLWSDVPPPVQASRAMNGTTSGQTDLWSDVPPEPSCGQEWYYFRSD